MNSQWLMSMGAEQAIKELNTALKILMVAEHTPDRVEKKYLEEKIAEAQNNLNIVNNWLHAIAQSR